MGIRPRGIMLFFVLALAARDVLFEIWISEDPLAFSLLLTTTVWVVVGLVILIRGEIAGLVGKLRRFAYLWRTAVLGLLAAIVYGVTFTVIDGIGAGLFNIIDWGLAPIFSLLFGWLWFEESPSKRFLLAILGILAGLLLIFGTEEPRNLALVLLAMASPLATVLSFALKKWFLDPERGGLQATEVLFLRFFPASGFLFLYSQVNSRSLALEDPVRSLVLALAAGVPPLFLLCSALASSTLGRLGVWLAMVPALAFFGTLHLHPTSQNYQSVLGACLVIVSVVVLEILERRKGE